MTDQPSSNPCEFDPAAVEAVAKAIEHMLDNFPGANDEYIRDVASAAIAALSAIGWVEGQRHAIVCDACETLTATYVAITRERDALRAALEKIIAWSDHPKCGQACRDIAQDAITAAKYTP